MTVQLADMTLKNPLMNGAYIGSKTTEDLEALINSASGAVVAGSITVQPRQPNADGGYWHHKEGFYTLNSFGMPNGGLKYFAVELPRLAALAHKESKPLIANVAGFSKEEWVTLVQLAQDSGVDAVELNFGCPNVWEKDRQEQIVSYHPEMVAGILETLSKEKLTIKIGVKLSPLPPDILVVVAQIVVRSGIVSFVTATNSYPNASQTTGTGDTTDKLAGLAGRSLKPISLGMVKQLSQLLPSEIDIIGCGGIYSNNDVQDYMEAGAKAVQIASALMEGNLDVFKQLTDDRSLTNELK